MPTLLPPPAPPRSGPGGLGPAGNPYRRRFPGFGFVLFAVGLGLVLFNVLPWWRLPHYSAAEVDGSVRVNVAADSLRLTDAQRADPVFMGRLTAQVRDEVQAEIAREREAVERPLLIGVLMLIVGLVDLVFFRLRQRRAGGAR